MTSEVTVHRALASPVRARLLELLRAAASPLSIGHLADRLDLHRNTVRSHLGVLEIAGLVEHETDAPDGPGRPRSLYRLAPDADLGDVAAVDGGGSDGDHARQASRDAQDHPDRGASGDVHDQAAEPAADAYRLLAVLLAGQVQDDHAEPGAVAEAAAASWSRRTVRDDDRDHPRHAEGAIERLLAVLASWGFETTVDEAADAELRLTFPRCPFGDVAAAHPQIACAVHRGITRGALEAMDGEVELFALDPGGVPSEHANGSTERFGGCVARLRSAT